MNALKLEYEGGGKYRLLEDFCFNDYCVPAGFVTDGASIPKVLWSVIGSPMTGKYVPVAVLHDYLYSKKCVYDVSFKKANLIFYAGMLKVGVNRFKAFLMYKAVCLFGKSHFKSPAKAGVS